MSRVKSNKAKIKVSGASSEIQQCDVPDFSIFFDFQYITSDKRHNFEYLINKDNKQIAKDLLMRLQRISQFSWEELRTKGKCNGGFETIEYSNFKESIANNIEKGITEDTKLYVFRFGGNKYRLIGHKAGGCKAALHILGFDFDYTLYDHGS